MVVVEGVEPGQAEEGEHREQHPQEHREQRDGVVICRKNGVGWGQWGRGHCPQGPPRPPGPPGPPRTPNIPEIPRTPKTIQDSQYPKDPQDPKYPPDPPRTLSPTLDPDGDVALGRPQRVGGPAPVGAGVGAVGRGWSSDGDGTAVLGTFHLWLGLSLRLALQDPFLALCPVLLPGAAVAVQLRLGCGKNRDEGEGKPG